MCLISNGLKKKKTIIIDGDWYETLISWQILQPWRLALSRTPTSQTFTEVNTNYLREYLHYNRLVTITGWSKLLGCCQMEQPESAFCHLPKWNLEIPQTEGPAVMSSPTHGLVLLRAKQHRQTHSLPFLQNRRFTKTWRAIAVNYYLHLFFIKNYDIMCKRPLWKDRSESLYKIRFLNVELYLKIKAPSSLPVLVAPCAPQPADSFSLSARG